jgi:hypothetical protein
MTDSIHTEDIATVSGFWKRLLCSHSYKRLTGWQKITESFGGHVTGCYRKALFQCEKCGKYKSFKIK